MEKFAEEVYDTMTGNTIPAFRVPEVENVFQPGSFCEQKYEEMIEAYWRLCERLGVEEDPDGEIMINALLDIQKELAMNMFRCGYRFGQTGSRAPLPLPAD